MVKNHHLSEEEVKSLAPEIYSMRLKTRWPYYDPEDMDRSWKYHIIDNEENLENKEIIPGNIKGVLSRYAQENNLQYYPDLYRKTRIDLTNIIKFPLDWEVVQDTFHVRLFHVTYIDPYIPIEYFPYPKDKKWIYIFNQETNQYIKYTFTIENL